MEFKNIFQTSKMKQTNIVKHKGIRKNKLNHFIFYMKNYLDIDNPNNKDAIWVSFIKVSIHVSLFFILLISLTYIFFSIFYSIGYVSVYVSPIFEHHTENETMIVHDYTQDGVTTFVFVFFLIFIILFVNIGIIIPVSRWRKVLEQEQKDLEVGNAVE